jgi:uncharacterized protein (DUF2252 family)
LKSFESPEPEQRAALLEARRNLKMARSAHAYVRGNTVRFYEWLGTSSARKLPMGPPVWICGDCHVGNLGPLGDKRGDVEIGIRDLDQTVIGNPAHDLIRLGLSLATAARGSALPGVATAHIMEALVEGYETALDTEIDDDSKPLPAPEAVKFTMKLAMGRKWRHLAEERIEDIEPRALRGEKFWALSKPEKREIKALFETERVRRLVTQLKSRPDDAEIELVDAAYWIKGCSSLGRLRYSVLLRVHHPEQEKAGHCLIDIKEALRAAAPRAKNTGMPKNDAERVVAGARSLSPQLGERMLATSILDTPVFLRELLPQDLKLEIETLTHEEARKAARYLAWTVGKAHARQMDDATRKTWMDDLQKNRASGLDAPSWLWRAVVELVASHEAGYLEHCRKFALAAARTA